jgi:hypothetical protein
VAVAVKAVVPVVVLVQVVLAVVSVVVRLVLLAVAPVVVLAAEGDNELMCRYANVQIYYLRPRLAIHSTLKTINRYADDLHLHICISSNFQINFYVYCNNYSTGY